jgi:RNA polymerase sigma-70 factor (ECF subfamily)
VEALRQACGDGRSERGGLTLDLAGVSFADSAGLAYLRGLRDRGVELRQCSPFMSELLGEVASSGAGGVGDGALLEALRRGDEAAFETLVRANAGPMHATARRVLGSDEEAADVVQEAFIQAWRSLEGFRADARLSTWLHSITVNQALMRLRKRSRRREQSIEGLLPQYHDDGHRVEPRAAWHQSSAELLEQEETRTLVWRSIDQLPDDYRSVLVLRDIEGIDTAAAARVLGITPGAAKVRLHRARQALRTLLERNLAPVAGGC